MQTFHPLGEKGKNGGAQPGRAKNIPANACSAGNAASAGICGTKIPGLDSSPENNCQTRAGCVSMITTKPKVQAVREARRTACGGQKRLKELAGYKPEVKNPQMPASFFKKKAA